MDRQTLIEQIKLKKNCLCIGLDPNIDKLPAHIERSPRGVELFCTEIIHHTLDHCVSYKFNLAFFESMGSDGLQVFEHLISIIPATHFIIADAKRGDIGNTATQYARAYFETMPCDAITISPYMGEDTVSPFMQFQGKWGIILGLTSNVGSQDFELLRIGDQYLYQIVMQKCAQWGSPDNMMFVIGATQSDHMKTIRKDYPHHFFLVPGIGAQGGSLDEVMEYMMNDDIGLLINSSREIIYADSTTQYAEIASQKAASIASKMASYIIANSKT